MGWERGEDIVNAGEIDEQAEVLLAVIADCDCEDGECTFQEDLDRLLRFRAEAQGAVHVWEPGTSFIADHYFDSYAEDAAYDLYGEVVKTRYFDLETFTEDYRERFCLVDYDGMPYWGDGN